MFIAGSKTICALQTCMYILQVAPFENVTPMMDISVSSHKLLRHHHFGPHEVTQVVQFVFPDGHLVIVLPQADCGFWFCASRVPGWEGLESIQVDNIKIEKIVSSSPLVFLASGRLRFLNLGCDTGHLSVEMSCSFTVQVPAQLVLLRKVTSIKAFKNDFQLLPKELDAGALNGEELLPIELLVCGTTPAGALDGKELLPIELEVEVTSPSCKSVASKSAGSSASPTPPFRRVRLRQQRHRS